MADGGRHSRVSRRDAPEKSRTAGEPLRVLLWSPGGSGLRYHGPGMAAYRLLRNIDPGRIRTDLAHGYPAQEAHEEVFSKTFLISALAAKDGGSFKSGAGAAGKLLSKLIFLFKAAKWLRANAANYDLFFGLSAGMRTLVPAILAERRGLPAVIVITGQWQVARGPLRKRLLGISRTRLAGLARVSGLVAVSREIQNALLDRGIPAEKIRRLPTGGVEPTEFKPLGPDEDRAALRAAAGLADRPTCLFAGGIAGRKRPHLVIEAIAQVQKRGLECRLVLAGPVRDEAYAARIKNLADEMGIADSLLWLGFRTDMPDLIRLCDVVCLPSAGEGLPSVPLQAMASGVPWVLTPFSGARDIVSDGVDGRIVSADATALADGLHGYLSNAALAGEHGERGRQKICQRFDTKKVAASYTAFFESLAGQTR